VNNIRDIVKKNNDLFCFSVKVRNRIPRKIYYPKDYFKILRLLKLKDLNKLNLESYRNKKLCNVLKEALEYVPYYKKLNLGIKSGDVTEENAFKILNAFPYLDKKIIMENPKDFINVKYNKGKLILCTCGGTTIGPRIDIWRTRRENLLEKCFFDYKWSKLGYKNNSKIVRISVEGIKREDEYPCSYVGDKMRISPAHLNKKWLEEIYNKIKEFKPEFFHSYPSSFQFLLQYMSENNLTIDNIKGIFLSSEIVTENLLNLSQSVFKDVPVIFHYGLTERSNLAWGIFEDGSISYKCDDIYGYSENFINKEGFPEIVGTSYWNYAMPIIRYNTHDLGKIENGIINNLDGRVQDLLITKQGEKISSVNIFLEQFAWKYVDMIQLVQNEPGKIEIHIKPKDNFNVDIKEKIIKSQKSRWENIFDILVVIDQGISKTESGKIRYVINNVR
jgi:phenylacetate-CoA ligase